jgi:hypothetical protein
VFLSGDNVGWAAAVNQTQQPRVPQCGETLILQDGRRFVFVDVDGGARGWWFTAQGQDESCTLQGNLRLRWDAQSRAWRPEGARAPLVPSSMRRTSSPPIRVKQPD